MEAIKIINEKGIIEMSTEFWQTVKEWICERIGHKLRNVKPCQTGELSGWCKRCGFYYKVD